MIYLDNAATSWPKPPAVLDATLHALRDVGANPGRAGHRLANESSRIVYRAREAVAELFGVADPLRVVFGANVTWALNLALRGLLRPGDHVITSSVEHNSVMRPLRALEREGVALTVVPCAPTGELDPQRVADALRPETTLIALNHASNVVGTVLPVPEVGAIARRHGALLLVDAAQTAGSWPIDLVADDIDLLAFTGHKSLYGPMGTGGLVLGERLEERRLAPLMRGGTGSRSELEEQPEFCPDKYEAGTPNVPGLAGLEAGVRWVLEQGVETLRRQEAALTQRLLDGLRGTSGVTLYGTGNAARQTATVSFTLAGVPPSEAGLRLDEEFAIMCRIGLHCSPACHRTLGTFPEGTVRFGLGAFTTSDEIDAALDAVRRLERNA